MNADDLVRQFEKVADAPNAIARLRRFILDLAVRGKLVSQNAGDAPASTLLDEIDAMRAGLATSAKASIDSSQVDVSHAPFELPRSWVWTRLGRLTSYIQRGKSPKYADSGGSPVVSQKCVQWSGLDLSVARMVTTGSLAEYDEMRFLRDGDLLWNSTGTGTIGRVVRLVAPPTRLVCDSHVTVVRCLGVVPEYVRVWLRSDHVYGTIEGRAAGSTNQVELTAQMAISQVVPLPPLAEQYRIIAKVDEMMALCDRLEAARLEREAARDRLTAASLARLNTPDPETFSDDARFFVDAMPSLLTRPQQVMQLRQTLLHLAVRGRLVARDPSDESASALLARISSMRLARAPAGKARSRTTLPPIDAEQAPFELPPGWAWARFPELGIFGRGKSKHRPRNDPALFVDGQHRVIQTGDVARSGGLIRTHTSKYNDVGLAQSHKWPAGTLCITIAANIADSGLLTFDACFPDSVVGFVPDPILGNAKYFEYFVRTAKANLLEFAPATAQKNINLEILESVLIPLPPLKEQQRIVARVDELMALCDQLVDSLHGQEVGATRLLDTLIAQAVEQSEAAEASA
jgi:type I restriction enzyme S subunit